MSTYFANANSAGLYDQTQYNTNRLNGQIDVVSNPNPFGLYNLSQVQTLNVGTPLLQRDGTGTFKLTLGLEQSTTLQPGSFIPLPMNVPQTIINGEGKLEFQFTSPDNAAFYRVQAQ